MMNDIIERLCMEAERELAEGNDRVADLLWSIAADFEDPESHIAGEIE